MNIIELIKNFFKPKKMFLPEPTQKEEKTQNGFYAPAEDKKEHNISANFYENKRNHFTKQLSPKTKIAPYNSFEHAIEQYLQSLSYLYDKQHIVNSYKALTSLEAYSNQKPGDNKKVEENLINILKHNPNYNSDFKVMEQKSSNGNVGFYHIQSKNYSYQYSKDSIRLYINIQRENISKFSSQLIKQLRGEDFYFKFVSDNQLDENDRSESIVIYTDTNHLEKIVQAINIIQQENPELTRNSIGVNPFMKKINNFTGYAPDVDGTYINENNEIFNTSPSFNTLLSHVLEDSYVSVAKELIAKDKELTLLTNGEIYDNSEPYVQLYPLISKKYNAQLIENMKYKLQKAKIRNDRLDINFNSNEDLSRDR